MGTGLLCFHLCHFLHRWDSNPESWVGEASALPLCYLRGMLLPTLILTNLPRQGFNHDEQKFYQTCLREWKHSAIKKFGPKSRNLDFFLNIFSLLCLCRRLHCRCRRCSPWRVSWPFRYFLTPTLLVLSPVVIDHQNFFYFAIDTQDK